MKTKTLRPLLCILAALACTSLAWGYAYITNTGTGLPFRWPPGTIPVRIYADNVTHLLDGSTAAGSVQASLQSWNAFLGNEQFTWTINPGGTPADNDSINQVSFAANVYGTAFDTNVLAVTTVWAFGNTRSEADTIFNTTYTWDSYRDSKTNHPHNTVDIQRVAIHELGHNLGLDHPDEHGQTISAIMNSHISDIFAQTADDIAGAQNLYGPNPLGSVPANNNFANAIAITLTNNAATMTGFTVNATKESGEPNNASNVGGRSVWWKWTAPNNGSVALDTAGSYSDTTLGVYTGSSVSNLTGIASNDDVSPGVIQHSALTFNATSGTTYYFSVDGFNGNDGAGADSAAITLNLAFTPSTDTAPQITGQPAASQTVNTGASVTFTVTATGSPAPSYQWKKNTVNIGGATSSSYNIPSVVVGDSGTYTVFVSNTAGSVTSNGAVLTVNPPPAPPNFTTQPASQTVTIGSAVTFTAIVTGSPAPTFQWKKGGVPIGGATGSTYSIAHAAVGDAGSYTLVATNTSGPVTSNPAILTVRPLAADFNGDGKSDLIWQDTKTGERDIWLMNGTTFASGAGLGVLPPDWVIAAVADFNADGKPDLLWQNTVTGEISIWLMNGTTFVSGVSLGVVPPQWSIAGAGDFSADGKPDIVFQNMVTGERSLWVMNGTAFLSGFSLGVVPIEWSIAGVADFNADGQSDLLWTNTRTGEVSIWLMNGTTLVTTVSLGIVPPQWQVAGIGDYNSDGQPDILVTNTLTGERSVWLMNGTAVASTVSIATIPLEWVLGRPIVRHVPVDFNADGNSDLVWQNTSTGERAIWLMDGTTFMSGVTLGVLPTSWKIAAYGDFNGDGKPDIVFQNTVTGERAIWLMDGTTFLAGVSLGVVPTDWSIAGTGDYNGDGKPDIVFQNTVTGERSIWVMNGTSFLTGVSLGITSTDWSIAAIADFNGDGKPDFLWQNTVTGERAIWLMNGTTFVSGISLGILPTAWSIAGTGDFNADGKVDIVWQNTVTGERDIWFMNGTTFQSGFILGFIPTVWTIRN